MQLDPAALCQIEIAVTDVARALAFYGGAFGWRPVPAEIHEYVVLEVPPGCPYGLALVPRGAGAGQGGGVVPYFAAEDAEAVARRAEESPAG